MKRQSTVAKLSKTMLSRLIDFCKTWNCGVILRIEGFEYGYTVDQLENLLQAWAQRVSNCRSVPCVRKGWESTTPIDSCQHRVFSMFQAIQADNPLVTSRQLLDWCSIEA